MRDIVLMMGPQGSGKGTQSALLREQTGMLHISAGALLRVAAAEETSLGQALRGIMSRGDIVPVEITQRILSERLSKPDAQHGVLLDGFPRTVAQAELFDATLAKSERRITHAIYLAISDETAHERLAGRIVCTNKSCERNYHVLHNPPQTVGMCDACGGTVERRADDTPEAIRNRLAIFHRETQPVAERYREAGLLHEIDGEQSIERVNRDILAVLGE